MPSLNEAIASFIAAWRLFLGRREALRLFDASFSGFWKSFLALVFLMPIYIPYILSERHVMLAASGLDEAAVPAQWFFFARAVALLVDWVAFPALLAAIAKPLGLERGYVPFIVAHNWGELLFSIPLALPAILFHYGVLSGEVTAILTLIGFGLLLRYFYIAARVALQTTVGIATALVATDVLLSLVLAELSSRLFGF
ncbi:MAG: hypothetical protein AAFX39_07115 [Pseudomonadota bacterium]